MIKNITNGIFNINGKLYTDTEWIEAWNVNETAVYYKCEMLNHGWCYKCYKPSVARLVLQRKMYLQMIKVG